MAQTPADDSKVSSLLNGAQYGCKPMDAAAVSTANIEHDYIVGWIGTPPEVGQIQQAGIGNVFNQEWQAVVKAALDQNGGLGDSTNGYLAFSSTYGFVRLRNPRLTPEQNRRLAEMSLVMGAPIERMPSSAHYSTIKDSGKSESVDSFIAKYDSEISDFLADKNNGVSISRGRMKFKMEVNEEAGRVVSYNYKKAGGLKGFCQKAMQYLGPVIDIASAALTLTGVGTAVAFGLQAVKTAGSLIASGGKYLASQLAGLAAQFVPWIGGQLGFGAMSATQVAAIRGGLQVGGELIDTGKLRPSTVISAVGGTVFSGLAGGPAADRVARQAINVVASAVETGRISPEDIVTILGTVALATDDSGSTQASSSTNRGAASQIERNAWDTNLIADRLGIDRDIVEVVAGLGLAVAGGIDDGKITASSVAALLGPVLGQAAEDAETKELVEDAIGMIAAAIDGRAMDARGFGEALGEYLSVGQPESRRQPANRGRAAA